MSGYYEKRLAEEIIDGAVDMCPREARKVLISRLESLRFGSGRYINQRKVEIEAALSRLNGDITKVNIEEANGDDRLRLTTIKAVMRESIPYDKYVEILREAERRFEMSKEALK